MSQKLKEYLTGKGVATKRITLCYPIGNGQCERYNDIIRKSIQLKPKSCDAIEQHWKFALPVAVHSIR